MVDVIEERQLSQSIAERTNIRHESPQAIVLFKGSPVWNDSHFYITEENLNRALAIE